MNNDYVTICKSDQTKEPEIKTFYSDIVTFKCDKVNYLLNFDKEFIIETKIMDIIYCEDGSSELKVKMFIEIPEHDLIFEYGGCKKGV